MFVFFYLFPIHFISMRFFFSLELPASFSPVDFFSLNQGRWTAGIGFSALLAGKSFRSLGILHPFFVTAESCFFSICICFLSIAIPGA